MRINKNYWLTASGTLAVTGAIMLFSAHRIEAQFSSPVRVLNTSSGPAITSHIDDPGRIPYQSSQTANCEGMTQCFFQFPAVPANHRLVVQRVTGYYTMSAGSAPASLGLRSAGGGFVTNFLTPIDASHNLNLFDIAVLLYFDAGQQPETIAEVTGTYNGSANSTLMGYMIDCSAAPCSAIAH